VRSPLLSRSGAVPGRAPDDAVAGHYGDPLREQRVALAERVVVARSHRDVIRVGGADRLPWLHSLTSQHLEALEPGRWTEALVLSPHGHVEHHLTLVDDGEATWIHVEPGTAAPLVAYLESMKFWSAVEPEDVSASYAILSVFDGSGFGDEIVPRVELPERVDVLGLPLVGHGAWEALRVAAGRPRLGFETDHRTIPHEIGWLETAVHLDKGCYRGQETVARVHNLGRPPRRLVRLHLDGTQEELPLPHTPVVLDDKAVGFLGTAVHHAELGPIALAVVKRQVADDAQLVVDCMAAAAESLVTA
jgi:folate-binding protein YgfZ